QRIEWNVERCYTVRTVAVISGLTVEGEPAPKACKLLKDTFPPAAPKGLAAVASEGAVNLIWEPNKEPDLAGYVVWRADAAGGRPVAVTSAPIADTTFTDTVPAGTRYRYTIQAVDKLGNAGPMSDPVEETPR